MIEKKAQSGRVNRVTVVVALGVLLAGGLGQRWVERLLIAADETPVALKRPLSEFPMQIGPWQGTDVPMDKRVLEVAGNDAQIYRRYVNADTHEMVDFYLAFAVRPAKMLGHRPQVCYPAHGWTPAGTRTEHLPLADGKTLECLVHRFTRKGGSEGGEAGLSTGADEAVVVLNYYVISGRYTTEWTDFWGPKWRLPNLARDPSIYVAQVQVSAAPRDVAGVDRAEELVTRFAFEVIPKIEGLLPGSTTNGEQQSGLDAVYAVTHPLPSADARGRK